jgi:hypothetical protein
LRPLPTWEIDLLGGCDAIAAAGIEEMARSAMDVVIADIFDKEKGALGELAFEHEGRFSGEFVGTFVNIPLMPRPPPNSHDHGNCT